MKIGYFILYFNTLSLNKMVDILHTTTFSTFFDGIHFISITI